jgi:hypothetical protein
VAVGEVLAEAALRVHGADVDQRQELVRRPGCVGAFVVMMVMMESG